MSMPSQLMRVRGGVGVVRASAVQVKERVPNRDGDKPAGCVPERRS
jgi:hypothetical protein